MARCCGNAGTCACKIEAGKGVTVTGTGTAQDPFVITSTRSMDVGDTKTFNLILTGAGTLESPWLLQVDWAPGAQLTDLPDVDAPEPLNGQVLTWDDTAGRWVPQAVPTTTPGAIVTGSGIEGDGSTGLPLEVTADEARYISITTDGVGLSLEGINRLVRNFPDAVAREQTPDLPEVGTLSTLDTAPGRIDYWTGTTWEPITNGVGLAIQPGQMLQLSGVYPPGGTVYEYVTQVSLTTDANGDFDVLSSLDLTGYAGVLHVDVQETGTIPWKCMVRPDVDRIVGRAYRLTDGTPYVGFTATATVRAMLY